MNERRNQNAWGSGPTQYFFELTGERILDAVEALGVACTGWIQTLNSFENRVYDLELEDSKRSHFVVKFYRPGRWNREQILEEHRFIEELHDLEIPVIPALKFGAAQETLFEDSKTGIFYSLFNRVGGRAVHEPSTELISRLGTLVGRMHRAGSSRTAPSRLSLDTAHFGWQHLDTLAESHAIPEALQVTLFEHIESVLQAADERLSRLNHIRVHGDLHTNNLLIDGDQIRILDFDDMLNGPAIQDFWMLLDADIRSEEWTVFLDSYEQWFEFNDQELQCVDYLRSLRIIHHMVWKLRRQDDPMFRKFFEDFGTINYWQEQIQQLALLRNRLGV